MARLRKPVVGPNCRISAHMEEEAKKAVGAENQFPQIDQREALLCFVPLPRTSLGEKGAYFPQGARERPHNWVLKSNRKKLVT